MAAAREEEKREPRITRIHTDKIPLVRCVQEKWPVSDASPMGLSEYSNPPNLPTSLPRPGSYPCKSVSIRGSVFLLHSDAAHAPRDCATSFKLLRSMGRDVVVQGLPCPHHLLSHGTCGEGFGPMIRPIGPRGGRPLMSHTSEAPAELARWTERGAAPAPGAAPGDQPRPVRLRRHAVADPPGMARGHGADVRRGPAAAARRDRGDARARWCSTTSCGSTASRRSTR